MDIPLIIQFIPGVGRRFRKVPVSKAFIEPCCVGIVGGHFQINLIRTQANCRGLHRIN